MSVNQLLFWLMGYDENLDEETKKEFNDVHNEFIKSLTWKQYILLYLPYKFTWKFFKFSSNFGSTMPRNYRNMDKYNCNFMNP